MSEFAGMNMAGVRDVIARPYAENYPEGPELRVDFFTDQLLVGDKIVVDRRDIENGVSRFEIANRIDRFLGRKRTNTPSQPIIDRLEMLLGFAKSGLLQGFSEVCVIKGPPGNTYEICCGATAGSEVINQRLGDAIDFIYKSKDDLLKTAAKEASQ
jgi:hypothetical protein